MYKQDFRPFYINLYHGGTDISQTDSKEEGARVIFLNSKEFDLDCSCFHVAFDNTSAMFLVRHKANLFFRYF